MAEPRSSSIVFRIVFLSFSLDLFPWVLARCFQQSASFSVAPKSSGLSLKGQSEDKAIPRTGLSGQSHPDQGALSQMMTDVCCADPKNRCYHKGCVERHVVTHCPPGIYTQMLVAKDRYAT